MLTRIRGLWRAARSVPVARTLLFAVDRVWWARVILRADVVDADFASLQLGRRVSARSAVRAYVSGGFRSGLSLNPLFAERLVSEQLPDPDRVPALYAYLATDPARIETSLSWDAVTYAENNAAPATLLGGPLGHAWRELRAGGSLELRGGSVTNLRSLHSAAREVRTRTLTAPAPPNAEVVLFWNLDQDDADGKGLQAPLAVLSTDSAGNRKIVLILGIANAGNEVRLQAAQLALGDPRVLLLDTDDHGHGWISLLGDGTLLVQRTPGSLIEPATLQALMRQRTGPAAPVWLAPDGVVASAGVMLHAGRPYRVLNGYPREDAAALGTELPVTALDSPVSAMIVGTGGTPRTLLAETVRGRTPPGPPALPNNPSSTPAPSPRGLRLDGWGSGPDVVIPRYVREEATFVLSDGIEVPRLRWAIKTAAPVGARGESWGETHFARALASALERHGQYAAVDALPARARPSSASDDVVLVLRGPRPLPSPAARHRLLWIISHPDEITASEVAGYDLVYAASTRWAGRASARFGTPLRPLLQCTDPQRFTPAGRARGDELLFVGTARGIARPSVVEPLRAGRRVRVYGPDWRGFIPGSAIAGTFVPNDALPALYESAGAVLNDHWPAMRREGFVSNRLFDVVAAGGRAISDEVEGITDLFGSAVRTYADVPGLLELTSAPLSDHFGSDTETAAISEQVRAEHSFDARARSLLEDVLACR
ncbi:glycosyltransferase [Microbacterium panaciterrae]|uniref:Spore protein YkvP/CgeB glycosyl transferase-like domain-containing protein n=1 Tax=Microbacterium panaciterrae TaxID=985759 RepID=A0ABP8PEL9_9MICO